MVELLVFLVGCALALALGGGLLRLFFDLVLRVQYHGGTSPTPNSATRL